MSLGSRFALLAFCGIASGCADPITLQQTSLQTFDDAASLRMYGIGDYRGTPSLDACVTGAPRQFDFWLGNWSVRSRQGVAIAHSRIQSALYGCAVLEYWLPSPPGLPGRSLNGFDADAGVWRQTWVTAAARPFRMSGGLAADGAMSMTGTRIATNGWHWIDTYTWTKQGENVIQEFVFDLPELGLHFPGRLTYEPVAPFPDPSALATNPRCASGDAAETRMLDFTVGRWRVTAENGQELGSSNIVIDPTMSGCLIEETFTTPKGYASRAFLYYDPVENRFYRSSVDNRGDWIELSGAPAVAPLVLEGAEVLPGKDEARVRMSWEQVDANQLRQVWSISKREGGVWKVAQILTFTRE